MKTLLNTRNLALLAIGLWGVTIIVVGTLFVRGQTTPGSDGRQAITLESHEKDLVLGEMRTMLESINGIVGGLSANDNNQIIEAARKSGSASTQSVPPSLMAKLPLEFKKLGMSVHQGFDNIVVSAQQEEPVDFVLSKLDQQLNRCVACHATYSFQSSEKK